MSQRLYRSRDDRMIAGVAGGLAERLDIDPAIVRIVWAILIVPTGFLAFLVYIVAALVIPDEDDVAVQGRWSDPPRPAGPSSWPADPSGPPAPWGPAPIPSSSPPSAVAGVAPGIGAPPPGVGAAPPDLAGSPMGAAAPPRTAPPPTPPPMPTYASRRERRRAQRATRRAERGYGTAPVLVGGGLIVLGSWFLVRDVVPDLDASRFWPIAVVGLGILVVLLALSRRSNGTDGDQR